MQCDSLSILLACTNGFVVAKSAGTLLKKAKRFLFFLIHVFGTGENEFSRSRILLAYYTYTGRR
jgi:hypothetical protein